MPNNIPLHKYITFYLSFVIWWACGFFPFPFFLTILKNNDILASPLAQQVKNLLVVQRHQVRSLSWEESWSRKWQPTLVFLPGESHGQRSLVGYSPWGHKEPNMTELLNSNNKYAYLRLLIFLPAILIPAWDSTSPVFHMVFSAYKLNNQGDSTQLCRTPFPILNQLVVPCPVLTVVSWPSYKFLRRQIRQSTTPIFLRIVHSWLLCT